MQTFLPYADFKLSAKALDYRRLGKQRVEAKQILLAMGKTKGGWINHPAKKMWEGHRYALCDYGIAMCKEWISRGYKDSMLPWFEEQKSLYPDTGLPSWMGSEDLHYSHRCNLTRKDEEYYSAQWNADPTVEYVWPKAFSNVLFNGDQVLDLREEVSGRST